MEILEIMKVPYYRNGKSIQINYQSQRYIKKHDLGGIAEAGLSFVPVYGSLMATQEAIKNPNWKTIGAAGLSWLGDASLLIPGIGVGTKAALSTGAKALSTASKVAKVASVTDDVLNTYNLGKEIYNTGHQYAQSKNTSQPIKQTGLLTQVQNNKIPNTI